MPGASVLLSLSAALAATSADPCDGLSIVALWQDRDGDGFGSGDAVEGCEAEEGFWILDPSGGAPDLAVQGYVENDEDCNDFNGNISPDAAEVCDGLDNDCDATVDDAADADLWFADGDGDGYGAGTAVAACAAPFDQAVTIGGDCDDLDATVHPGADEDADGVDEDCDGRVDEGVPDEEARACGCGPARPAATGSFLGLLLALRRRRASPPGDASPRRSGSGYTSSTAWLTPRPVARHDERDFHSPRPGMPGTLGGTPWHR